MAIQKLASSPSLTENALLPSRALAAFTVREWYVGFPVTYRYPSISSTTLLA